MRHVGLFDDNLSFNDYILPGYARTCSVLILPVDIFSRLTMNLLLFLSSFPSSGARL